MLEFSPFTELKFMITLRNKTDRCLGKSASIKWSMMDWQRMVGLFWKDCYMWFLNRFFPLILTEWLRIRLFSTYITTILSVEICSKKSAKMFLLPEWYFWVFVKKFLYCESYKENAPQSFSTLFGIFAETLLRSGCQRFQHWWIRKVAIVSYPQHKRQEVGHSVWRTLGSTD